MKSLYTHPLRVYLLLGSLMLLGLGAAFQLPMSLYPEGSRTRVLVGVPYGAFTGDEFFRAYGEDLERRFRRLEVDGQRAKKIQTELQAEQIFFRLDFGTEVKGPEAFREVESILRSAASTYPEDIRRNAWTWLERGNTGFFAVSFSSSERSMDDLHRLVRDRLLSPMEQIPDADRISIFNPSSKQLSIEFHPSALAQFQLFPSDVEQVLSRELRSYSGGRLQTGSTEVPLQLAVPEWSVSKIRQISIPTPTGVSVPLARLADVDLKVLREKSQIFKTSGVPSIILIGRPRPDGNLQRMSSDLVRVLEQESKSFPPDLRWNLIVDPSMFIERSIQHVAFEVALAAFLAVLILFLMIGNLRNVALAAIEIPLSLVLAFLLMKISGVSLNLISLAGLALSAGMNVDASVVVIENILRHQGLSRGKLRSFQDQVELVLRAVREVALPILAATLSSLVIFVPLAFTEGITRILLADLAKTVIFSHGFSALVALILVPTVRLHLFRSAPLETHRTSPLETPLQKLEGFYARSLRTLLNWPRRLRFSLYAGMVLLCLGVSGFVLSERPREIVALPDSDFLSVQVSSSQTTSIADMEEKAAEIDRFVLEDPLSRVESTFQEIESANSLFHLIKLKRRSDMKSLWTDLEEKFEGRTDLQLTVESWNPSELPLPNNPDLKISLRGSDPTARNEMAERAQVILQNSQIYQSNWSSPDLNPPRRLILSERPGVPVDQLADLVTIATEGRESFEVILNEERIPVQLSFEGRRLKTLQELEGFPVGWKGKIVPLRALSPIAWADPLVGRYRENQQDIVLLEARLPVDKKSEVAKSQSQIQEALRALSWPSSVRLEFLETRPELHDALHQLSVCALFAILLIFLCLVLQLGSLSSALLVMVAVPLGSLGVFLSLWIFNSNLSLNSFLGLILQSGLAVGNSILLVDFVHRRWAAGREPHEAIVEACVTRLRPILITSLTTICGMLPLAFGLGQGGRILQPLGIAVAGGLWVSTLFTLILVPMLQAEILGQKKSKGIPLELVKESHG